MKKYQFFFILLFIFAGTTILWSQAPDYLVMRSEFETIGNHVVDVDATDEASVGYNYAFTSGNEAGYFELRRGTGLILIAQSIPDQVGVITEHTLVIQAESYDNTRSEEITVRVVDMYDYLISTTPHTAILDGDQDHQFNGPWTAYNNLWGMGSAVPGQDFRIAIMITDEFPGNSIILWDVPGQASAFGGSSVWNFSNFFMGNRDGMRTDVPNFPFKIADAQAITLDYDMELIITNSKADTFKLALNTFLTDEDYLAPFSANDGDFFFVPDQIRTYIPSYPVTLSDISIGGKSFAMLYKDNPDTGYEWRRVIIKDEEKLITGPVDLLNLFNIFAGQGYLDKQQHIYHLMFGIEVTEGFGAYRINRLDINISLGSTSPPTPQPTITPTIQPTPDIGLPGDVNSDSTVDIVDALLVAQYYVGLNPVNFTQNTADVNCDSMIDIVDALLIAQFYVGLIAVFFCHL